MRMGSSTAVWFLQANGNLTMSAQAFISLNHIFQGFRYHSFARTYGSPGALSASSKIENVANRNHRLPAGQP